MDVTPDTPQRLAVVIERTKSEAWGVGAYRVTAGGHRDRRSVGVYDSYVEAADALRTAWEKLSV